MKAKEFVKSSAALVLAGTGAASIAQIPIGVIVSEQSRTAFTIQGAGARATGLGGAFIAVADDATAVSFNPAGLAQLLKPEVSFVGRGYRRDVAYADVSTTSGTKQLLVSDSLISSNRFDPLFFSGFVPLRAWGRTLALQFSIQRLIPLGESDSRDLAENPAGAGAASQLHQSIVQGGQIDLYSTAIAYEFSQRVLGGVAVNVWRGKWDLDSKSSKTTAGATSFVNFGQSNRLEASNFNFGLLWRWPTWSLGVTHRTAFHADYTFGTILDTSSAPGKPTISEPYTTGLHWPSTTGIGFAYRPSESWLVTTDLARTPCSKARYMSGRSSLNGLSFFDLDKGTRTPDSTNFHMGVERIFLTTLGGVVPVRFGLSREPQPVVDRVTSQQRVMYSASLGTGIKRGPYTVDFAYRYGWAKRRSSQFLDVDQIISKSPPTSLGNEKVIEQRLDLSFIVQFEREPIERLLRYLFVGD
jgi:hypothetical protein